MNYFKIIKAILTVFPLLWLVVLLDPSIFPNYWEFAWRFLILLLFIRPIRDIFPEYKILSQAVRLRKELGIISGVFAIAHTVWYFLVNGLPVTFIFDSIMWDPRWYLWWWMFAFIISLILTWTSNIFSIKKLWKKWKLIQRLSYFMLLFTAVHVALVKPEALISILVTVASYIIVYILAHIYKKV
jgi:sulfoxide reductase heme-binding subunit YedZ